MIKKVLRYTDFNDKQVEKTCYFHLSRAELVELEMSVPGGFQAYIQKVLDAEDQAALVKAFKDLILKAYGKRTEDGSGFVKSDELRQEFYSSQAYDALFMELSTDADAAAQFVNGIVPQKELEALNKKIDAKREEKRTDTTPAETENVFEKDESRVLTPQEIREMDPVELQEGLAQGLFRVS